MNYARLGRRMGRHIRNAAGQQLVRFLVPASQATQALVAPSEAGLKPWQGGYDAAIGHHVARGRSFWAPAIARDYGSSERDGTLIQASDFELAVAASDLSLPPSPSWQVETETGTSQVVSVRRIPRIGDAVMYRLQLRS